VLAAHGGDVEFELPVAGHRLPLHFNNISSSTANRTPVVPPELVDLQLALRPGLGSQQQLWGGLDVPVQEIIAQG
jgi:hypothetical protein